MTMSRGLLAMDKDSLKRKLLFALIMSGNTALITTGAVVAIQAKHHANAHTPFISQWLGAFITVWPVVFVAILIIAPLVNKLLDRFL